MTIPDFYSNWKCLVHDLSCCLYGLTNRKDDETQNQKIQTLCCTILKNKNCLSLKEFDRHLNLDIQEILESYDECQSGMLETSATKIALKHLIAEVKNVSQKVSSPAELDRQLLMQLDLDTLVKIERRALNSNKEEWDRFRNQIKPAFKCAIQKQMQIQDPISVIRDAYQTYSELKKKKKTPLSEEEIIAFQRALNIITYMKEVEPAVFIEFLHSNHPDIILDPLDNQELRDRILGNGICGGIVMAKIINPASTPEELEKKGRFFQGLGVVAYQSGNGPNLLSDSLEKWGIIELARTKLRWMRDLPVLFKEVAPHTSASKDLVLSIKDTQRKYGHSIYISLNPPSFCDPNDLQKETLFPVTRIFNSYDDLAQVLTLHLAKVYPTYDACKFQVFERTK